jgi:type I restriction enzyme, S subunit
MMKSSEEGILLNNWCRVRLDNVADINPKLDKTEIEDDTIVSFVPMTAVEAESGNIDVSQTRQFRHVKKGYTTFRKGDILFAKITPCMENGKVAVVPPLRIDVGFGSTEFHVLRPYHGVEAKYLYYFVSVQQFRYDAEHNMTGAVGQPRVTTPYLSSAPIPVPPSREQGRIVAKLDELFSELDKGIERLATAKEQLTVYRQAVLKNAFEGNLTALWRRENKETLQSVDEMVATLQLECKRWHQKALQEWNAVVKTWEAGGGKSPRPRKPSAAQPATEISAAERELLPTIPDSWKFVRLSDIAQIGSGMSVSAARNIHDPVEVAYLRVANVQRGFLDLSEIKRMVTERHH